VSVGFWDCLVVTAKAITYASTLGAAGGVFFLSYSHSLVENDDRLIVRRLVRILMVVAVCAGGARIAATAASMSGEVSGLIDSGLMRMVWQAGEGRAVIVRTAGLLLALPAVLSNRPPAALSIVAAGGAATSFGWVGHAQALGSGWAILSIGVHLLGVAFWLGALAPLLLITRHDEPRRIAAAAARFGTAAVIVVGALALAGLGMLCMLLDSVTQLWNSSYGRYVTVKLGFAAALLGFAAFNKLRLTPRLLADDICALRSLRRSISAELVLGLLILSVTAALTTLTGPPALK
jgi:copper resistance protein D